MLVCLFVFIVCFLYLSIPKIVLGQQFTFVKNVFNKYEETFKHPDIQKHFPSVLRAFKDKDIQIEINSPIINHFVKEPNFIRAFYPDTHDSIVQFLAIDPDFRALFREQDFHKVLQNPTAIEQLAVLIENIQIPTVLVKFSGDSQSGNTDNRLQKPFIVVVKDQKGNPIERITVTFRIISGFGEFSNRMPTTNSSGQASTIFTLGSTPGPTLIEARVDGIGEPVIFTATATTTGVEVPKPSELVVSLSPSVIASPEIGEEIVLTVRIKRGESITGYEITMEYDHNAIKYVSLKDPKFNCDYLPTAYQFKEKVEKGKNLTKVMLTAVSPFAENSGDGILAKLTFRVIQKKASTVTLAKVNLYDPNGNLLSPILKNINVPIMDLNVNVDDENLEAVDIEDFNGDGKVNSLDLVLVAQLVDSAATKVSCVIPDDVDVNGDGIVNILDLVLVASKVGFLDDVDVNRDGIANILDLILVANKIGETDDIDDVDVNKDGEVNVLDLILVVGKIGESPTAPSLYSPEQFDLSTTDIQGLITQIKAFQINRIDNSVVDPAYQRGIAILEDLLKSLMQAQKEVPQKTALFVNYPNPFNPETWIPYQLGEATDVTVTIHAMNGSLVRRLSLGHQVAGVYRSKNRAAYWDGRNAFGEPVASGIYFYTLTAGNYSATGKMLIRK